jgi:predicted DNA-binding protein (MmcQ/YjbR family)
MIDFDSLHAHLHQFAGVSSAQQWGENMVYKVGGKVFFLIDIPTAHIAHLAFKVPKESFPELTDREGIIQAPYFAKGQWVQVQETAKFNKEELNNWVATSYQLVLEGHTKKAVAEIASAGILPY